MRPGCPDVLIEEYVYDEVPGSGQLPWGLYDVILVCELCELPLLIPVDTGLKLSVPVTPGIAVSMLTSQMNGMRNRRWGRDQRSPFRNTLLCNGGEIIVNMGLPYLGLDVCPEVYLEEEVVGNGGDYQLLVCARRSFVPLFPCSYLHSRRGDSQPLMPPADPKATLSSPLCCTARYMLTWVRKSMSDSCSAGRRQLDKVRLCLQDFDLMLFSIALLFLLLGLLVYSWSIYSLQERRHERSRVLFAIPCNDKIEFTSLTS